MSCDLCVKKYSHTTINCSQHHIFIFLFFFLLECMRIENKYTHESAACFFFQMLLIIFRNTVPLLSFTICSCYCRCILELFFSFSIPVTKVNENVLSSILIFMDIFLLFSVCVCVYFIHLCYCVIPSQMEIFDIFDIHSMRFIFHFYFYFF